MTKDRLLAFSDGVIAIIITIMVLEMHAPHEATWKALLPLLPIFMSYVLSFIFVGIYWNNHHHMLHAVHRVNGGILWANLFLLFWLSLVPFVTAWMGQNNFAPVPVVLYGLVLIMAAVAYYILEKQLLNHHGVDSVLSRATGMRIKEKASIILYAAALPLAFVHSSISLVIYGIVAVLWLVPDRRIEKTLHAEPAKK
jgi:uncharacterized membrane protein